MTFPALSLCLGALLCGLVAPAGAAAGHGHQHGVAKLDVAVEYKELRLHLDSPLHNLLGFEHAPRTPAERQAAEAVVAQLKAADRVFKIDPLAGCKLEKVELTSALLKLGMADPARAQDDHSDLEGDFSFTCMDAGKAAYIDVDLSRFVNLQRLEVQVATPKGQFKRSLRRPTQRLNLVR